VAMLLEVICPHCQAQATQMPILSEISTLDFFLCTKCGKISEREKAPPTKYPVSSAAPPLKILEFGGNGRRDPASR